MEVAGAAGATIGIDRDQWRRGAPSAACRGRAARWSARHEENAEIHWRCARVSGTSSPRDFRIVLIAVSASWPPEMRAAAAISADRPMPWRQWTVTFLPACSALISSAVDSQRNCSRFTLLRIASECSNRSGGCAMCPPKLCECPRRSPSPKRQPAVVRTPGMELVLARHHIRADPDRRLRLRNRRDRLRQRREEGDGEDRLGVAHGR